MTTNDLKQCPNCGGMKFFTYSSDSEENENGDIVVRQYRKCRDCSFNGKKVYTKSRLEYALSHNDKPGTVYFFKASNGYVKIGWSSNVKKRLKAIRLLSAVDIELIGYFEGTINDEKKLHKRFSNYHKHGEWFELSDEIMTYIKNLPNW